MSCSFTYQLKKILFRSPVKKNYKTLLSKVRLLNGRNIFNNKSNNFIKKSLFTLPPLHNKIFHFAPFWGKQICPIFSKFRPKFIMQRGYCEQTLFYKFFYLLLNNDIDLIDYLDQTYSKIQNYTFLLRKRSFKV